MEHLLQLFHYISSTIYSVLHAKDYLIHIGIIICIYQIFAQSFNLTFGLGGLFNLSHVASFAIGAYTAALLSTELNAGFPLCIVAGVFLSGLFAFLVEIISYRLKEDYFAIGTLAFSSVVTALLINWKSLTRGVLGIPGIPRPELMGVDYIQNVNFLWLVFAFTVAVNAILWVLFRNPYSRALRSQAEFPQAVFALGKNADAVKNTSFFVASAIAGLAGCFFAYYINYIDPSSFTLAEMIFAITIVVFGGPGSFWGISFATLALFLIQESLRFVSLPSSILGPMRQLIYALILFAVVYVRRASLFPRKRTV